MTRVAAAEEAVTRRAPSGRAYLLERHLDQSVGTARWELYGGAVLGTVAAGAGVALAIVARNDSEFRPQIWPVVGGLGVLTLVGASTYVLPEQVRYPIVRDVMVLGFIPALLGLTVLGDRYSTPADKFSAVAVIATGGVMASLGLIDLLLKPRVSQVRLRAHWMALKQARGNLAPEQLAAIERDYELMDRPIPAWLDPALAVLGGLVSLSPLVVQRGDPGVMPYYLAGTLFTLGAASAFVAVGDTGYHGYARALRNFHLVPVGPRGTAGFTMSVSF